MKKTYLLLILTLLLLNSCVDENRLPDDLTPPNTNTNNPTEVTATIFGKITDENGEPIYDATLTLGNYQTTTNSLGLYVFKNVTIPTQNAFMKVVKSPYFDSGKVLNVLDESINKTNIQLLRKKYGGFFQSDSDTELTLGFNGDKVAFQANSIVDVNGQDYSGIVNVVYNNIATDSPDFDERTPGGLLAVDADGEDAILESYGMLGLELMDQNNNPLNIKSGQTATITIPVASDQLANAPQTIPLWHLNEDTGIWEEEGFATLQGNEYIGEVGHFSFWNCDDPYRLVKLTFQVVDENNNPVPYLNVYASLNNGDTESGKTNSNGFICSQFPAGQVINISSGLDVSFDCNTGVSDNFLDENIGPFYDNQTIGPFVYNVISNNSLVSFNGTVSNTCNNPNPEEIIAIISASNSFSPCTWEFFIDDNSFDFSFPDIGAPDYEVYFYDLANNQLSQTYTLINGTNDLGVVSVCEQIEQYINLTMGNDNYSVSIPFASPKLNTSLNEDFNFVSFNYYDDGGLIPHDSLRVNVHLKWTDTNDKLNTSYVNFYRNGNIDHQLDCWGGCQNVCNLQLTEFGTHHGYVIGNISGELNNLVTGQIENYNLDFKIQLE